MDCAFGLVNSVLNLPKGQVNFLGKLKLQKDCNQSGYSKMVLGLGEMTCGLVHASHSLPEWQAVKLTFFAPWTLLIRAYCPSVACLNLEHCLSEAFNFCN